MDDFKAADRVRGYSACRCKYCLPPSGSKSRSFLKTTARRNARRFLRADLRKRVTESS